MEIIAKLNYLRISPRKVRLVADLVRGKKVTEAERELRFLTKRAAGPIAKLLRSAAANASHNFNLQKENLYISKITVDGGATLKRIRPRAFGRAFPIRKRTSHITLVLSRIQENQLEKQKTRKTAPVISSAPDEVVREEVGKRKFREPIVEKLVKTRKPTGVIRKVFQRKAI